MIWLVCVHPVEMSMEQSLSIQKIFRIKPSRALQFFNERLLKIGKYIQSSYNSVGSMRVPNMSSTAAYPAWSPD